MMADVFALPDWLEAYAVNDASMADAYEALGAESRSVLKKCIARLHRIWGESPERAVSLRCPSRGFCLECEDLPADAAVIVCEADYRHPVAFLAALMPAVLSGARLVLPFFLSPGGSAPSALSGTGAPPAAPLLAALELAGVEHVYLVNEGAALDFVLGLPSDASRLVLVGEKPFGQSLVLHAHNTGLPCRSFVQPPRYYNERLGRMVELSFAMADAGSRRVDEPGVAGSLYGAPVCLDADHENVWIWPDLGPEWFRLRRMRLFSPRAS